MAKEDLPGIDHGVAAVKAEGIDRDRARAVLDDSAGPTDGVAERDVAGALVPRGGIKGDAVGDGCRRVVENTGELSVEGQATAAKAVWVVVKKQPADRERVA